MEKGEREGLRLQFCWLGAHQQVQLCSVFDFVSKSGIGLFFSVFPQSSWLVQESSVKTKKACEGHCSLLQGNESAIDIHSGLQK